MGFILFYVSWVLHLLLRVVFSLYKPIFFFSKYGFKGGWYHWNRHHLHQALAEDQAANVSMYMVLNKFFTKGKADYHYGDEDDTISYASSMSYHIGDKGGPATGVIKFLRFVDKDHDTKSINGKIVRDLEAMHRLQEAGIIKAEQLIPVSIDQDDDAYKHYVKNVRNKKREISL